MLSVSEDEAAGSLSDLLDRVAGGERVVITRTGRPVADLVPHPQTEVVFGLGRGTIEIAEDFDAPCDDLIAAVEGN